MVTECDGAGNGDDTGTAKSDPFNTIEIAKDGPEHMVTDGAGDGDDTGTAISDPVNTIDTAEVEAEPFQTVHPIDQPLLDSADPSTVFTAGRRGGHGAHTTKDCTSGFSNNGSSLRSMGPYPTPLEVQTGQQTGPAQNPSSSRVQHDPAMEPEPARYVNFLFYEGYSVEILGGKHFKTRDGEFVEMKSGTQYKILVKNSHTYGCHLDISIDGFDVGGWALHGGEEISIERSAYEAKTFTFYRVKTAPKEAGIESGRAENGLVKCVFTPEAFLNIPVTISGSSQSLNVSMAPCATVGDLKHEMQSQLEIQNDPDQVLAQDDKLLSNAARLKRVLGTPGNLRLIDAEMTITVTVEASSSVPSPKTFPIKVHPGKAKVHDLMEQIERELNVPVSDQKLYFGRTLLSGAPRRCLPDELICSSRPAVAVTLPEYFHITVEEQNGDSHAIKIDKEKNLRAVLEEIPPCRNLQENTQVMFDFNEEQLCPFTDERTLNRLGICSGSKLELVIKILFIEVEACFSDGTPSVRVRCSPQDTFQDLVKKIRLKNKREKWRFTFAMDTRIFHPDQDKSPLQDYGITHGCTLNVTRHPATDDTIVPHETVHSSQLEGWLSDVPGKRKVQEKKSFFCILKEKLFKKPLGEHRRMETAGSCQVPPLRGAIPPGKGSCQVPPLRGAIPPGKKNKERIVNSLRKRSSRHLKVITRNLQVGSGRNVVEQKHGKLRELSLSSQGRTPPGAIFPGKAGFKEEEHSKANRVNVVESDPEWRSGGTTLQGHSTQRFITAEPIKVDPSRKVELVLRLVAREGEKGLKFPEGKCTPLSTLIPPAVQE
ncbi:uncharacterized protein LOC111342140 isoform X2 [Stylophora pistillata]|uniref:uncharacterized protein LOC111342140 isoform X2 n=1 Tax=Stylophora pistillata TaxID=50429 RepID=UPI000C055EA3|nr:uncharacterized protein LOC111342140 isoform X2 [Stylophora pistillata]